MFYATESNNLIDQEFCGQKVKTRQLKYLKWLNQFAVSMDVYPNQRISIIAQFSFDILQFNIGNYFWHIVCGRKLYPFSPLKITPPLFTIPPVLKKSIPLHCTNFFFVWQFTLAEFCNARGVSHLNPTSSHGSYS